MLLEGVNMKTGKILVIIFMVLEASAFFASSGVVLPVSCTQTDNWVRILKVSYAQELKTIEVTINLTSSVDIKQVEMCSCFAGLSQPANLSMTLLDNSSWQGLASTLWSAEIPAPETKEFTLILELYVTNVHGSATRISVDPVHVSIQSGSEKRSSLGSAENFILLFLLLPLGVLFFGVLHKRRLKASNSSDNPKLNYS